MKKKILRVLAGMAIALGLISSTACINTQAATTPKLETSKSVYYIRKKTDDFLGLNNVQKNARITVKSSNKKVVDVSLYDKKKYDVTWFDDETLKVYNYGVNLKLKKPGSSTITCTVKQGKKTYNLKCKVIVIKYKTPIKVQIGNISYNSEFKNDDVCSDEKLKNYFVNQLKGSLVNGEITEDAQAAFLKRTAVVKVTPQKGFKVSKIWLSSDPLFGSGKTLTLKNGKSYSYDLLTSSIYTDTSYDSLNIMVVGKKYKEKRTFSITLPDLDECVFIAEGNDEY